MKSVLQNLRSVKGVSLLEILVAMLLTGIVLAAVFKVYVTQHKNWSIQGEVVEMQQNARAAIDEMGRQIRMAGYQLPSGLNAIEASNTDPDTITVRYSPDGCVVGLGSDMANPSDNIRASAGNFACFDSNQTVYIHHPDSGFGEYFVINTVLAGDSIMSHAPLLRAYDHNAFVMSLQKIKFYLDKSDSLHPNLMLELSDGTPHVYAENIYDLHFKYKMNNGVVVDVPVITEDVRGVTIVIYARTSNKDFDNENDPYRRRAYVSEVNLRNLDI